MEWAAVTTDVVVVATSQHQWVHPAGAWGPFAHPMTGPGTIPTTRALLDAAARTGWAAAGRTGGALPFTVLRWAYKLCGFYRTTHATPPLMLEAAARFTEMGRPALALWAETKAHEERGHDTLVLRDLRALGLDAERAIEEVVPAIPAALVRSFEALVRTPDPTACVGYTYALERLALEVDAGYIDQVEQSLPAGVRATRCLRVHSGVGSDRAHVDETVALVAGLSGEDRTRIARACHQTAILCYAPREDEPLADETLERLFGPLTIAQEIEQ